MGTRDESFLVFYEAQLPQLRRLAYRLTGNRADAEDLADETMLRVFRVWRRVEHTQPQAYARTVLINRQRSLVQRARREALHLFARADDRATERDEDAAGVWQELMRLPAKQRAAIALHFYEDLPQTEVAQIMGCPAGTVNSLVYRGLERLRERLKSHEESRSEIR